MTVTLPCFSEKQAPGSGLILAVDLEDLEVARRLRRRLLVFDLQVERVAGQDGDVLVGTGGGTRRGLQFDQGPVAGRDVLEVDDALFEVAVSFGC